MKHSYKAAGCGLAAGLSIGGACDPNLIVLVALLSKPIRR